MRRVLQRKNPTTVATALNANVGRPALGDRQKSYYKPDEFKGREFPLVYKPKVIKKIGDCCYVFHCTTKGNSGSRFNKNMIVLVDPAKEQVSVVNPLRLTGEGEEKLLELGTINGTATMTIHNLIRLAPSEHAAFEDNYYLVKFGPGIQRWAPGPFPNCPHLPVHKILWDTTNTRILKVDAPINPVSPHPDLQVFVFEETVQPEALLWHEPKKLLIAGDCLQAQLDNPFVDAGGRANLEENGLLLAPVVVSERWIKSQSVVANRSKKVKADFKSRAQKNNTFFSSSGKFKLRNDFVRLMKLEQSMTRMVSTSGNQVLQSITVTVQADEKDPRNNNDETISQEMTVPEAILKAVERACRLV